jgi:hypothetical protein
MVVYGAVPPGNTKSKIVVALQTTCGSPGKDPVHKTTLLAVDLNH